jgi:hypothetical protein
MNATTIGSTIATSSKEIIMVNIVKKTLARVAPIATPS